MNKKYDRLCLPVQSVVYVSAASCICLCSQLHLPMQPVASAYAASCICVCSKLNPSMHLTTNNNTACCMSMCSRLYFAVLISGKWLETVFLENGAHLLLHFAGSFCGDFSETLCGVGVDNSSAAIDDEAAMVVPSVLTYFFE